MTGEINYISKTLGALEAGNAEMLRRLAASDGETVRHREWITGRLEEIGKKLASAEQLRKDVDDMKPAVDDWRAMKQRGIGVIAAAGIAGGGIAVAIGMLAKKLGWSG